MLSFKEMFLAQSCSKQVDTFARECLEDKKYFYLYKGEGEIPPVSMVGGVVIKQSAAVTQLW